MYTHVIYFNHFTSVQNKMDFNLIRRLNVLGDLSIRNQCDKKKFLNAISTIFSIFFFSLISIIRSHHRR